MLEIEKNKRNRKYTDILFSGLKTLPAGNLYHSGEAVLPWYIVSSVCKEYADQNRRRHQIFIGYTQNIFEQQEEVNNTLFKYNKKDGAVLTVWRSMNMERLSDIDMKTLALWLKRKGNRKSPSTKRQLLGRVMVDKHTKTEPTLVEYFWS